MTAQVIEIASRESVDQAWDDYTAYAKMLSEDRSLLVERSFHEEFARRYDRWRRLFLMQDGGR